MSLRDALQGTPNVGNPLPWLATAGQPSAEQLTAARDAGVRVVIDLRDAMEPRPFDEPATVRGLGMEYVNIPIVSGALTPESLGRILETLRANAGTPTLLHCASSNRVGGALIPYFILDQGMDEQSAVDLAMQSGLRSAELMEWGTAYARNNAK